MVPGPGRLPPMPGPVRPVFQRTQVSGIVAWLPEIKCLPADPEIATSQGHLPSVGVIVVEPDQPFASLLAQLGRAPLQGSGAGYSYPFNLHRDTLHRVSTIIILNEHMEQKDQSYHIFGCSCLRQQASSDLPSFFGPIMASQVPTSVVVVVAAFQSVYQWHRETPRADDMAGGGLEEEIPCPLPHGTEYVTNS